MQRIRRTSQHCACVALFRQRLNPGTSPQQLGPYGSDGPRSVHNWFGKRQTCTPVRPLFTARSMILIARRCVYPVEPEPFESRCIDFLPRHLLEKFTQERTMIRLIAVAFALALATSAQAMPLAPLQQADGITTLVRFGCGPGRTLVAGRCVARTTIRHTRRVIRRNVRGY